MLKKKVAQAAIVMVMGAVLAFPPVTHAAAPAPVIHKENANANFGNWYTGAVPANSTNKPVILFVQGLHSDYSRWINGDAYYDAAYNAGYRTAFVQLKDADGSGGDNNVNGQVLAGVIRKVAEYYGVPKINIIAHSKGGIDTQTALVNYGAAPYVNVVHQLSTPNKGTELADYAYSFWTGWIADLLGQRDDAVYSLQTSYMSNFRSQTDNRSENNLTKTYMAAGTGNDGLFSSTWWGQTVISGYSDGYVNEASAFGLPYGIKSFSIGQSHSNMASASKTWSLVQPKLALAPAAKASLNSSFGSLDDQADQITEAQAAPTIMNSSVAEAGNLILRGGAVNGSESVSLPLESGINSVALEVMTSKEDTVLTLVSPSGQAYYPQAAPADNDPEDIFKNAVKRVFQVTNPEAGEWSIQLSGSNDAYFALAEINTANDTTVKAVKKVFRKGEASEISVKFDKQIKGSAKHPKLTKSGSGVSISSTLPDANVDGGLTLPFTAPTEPGVYNLAFDVEGVNDKGEKVVRSINYNLAVADDQGKVN